MDSADADPEHLHSDNPEPADSGPESFGPEASAPGGFEPECATPGDVAPGGLGPGGLGPESSAPGLTGRRPARNRLLLGGVAAAVLLVDQLTKLWAVRALDDRTIDLFWTLRFRLVWNRGTAFGLGSSLAPVITVGAVVVSLLLIAAVWSTPSRRVAGLAGVVLGGALGNLGDRAFRGDGFFGGSVVDFVDLQWWPVFNVADAAISVGVAIFAVLLIHSGIRGRPLPSLLEGSTAKPNDEASADSPGDPPADPPALGVQAQGRPIDNPATLGAPSQSADAGREKA